MTVDSLIANLSMLREHGLAGTSVVKAYNADSGQLEEVSGFLYDNDIVEVCTDDND